MAESITVAWPPLPLAEPGWRQRLECLAGRAEALVGRRSNPQQEAALAVEWLGVAWPALSPALIAGSCRASLLLGSNVVLAPAPADQLLEVAERLDEVWADAQADPDAAVVTVRPPLLNSAPLPAVKPRGRAPKVEPPPAPAADPDELPPGWEVGDPEPAPPPAAEPARGTKPLRDRALRMAAKPAPPEPEAVAKVPIPEPEPEPLEPAEPAPDPEPEPPPVPEASEPVPVPVPDGFASAPQLAAEIGAKPTAIGVWAMRNLSPDDIHRGAGRRVWFRRDAVIGVYKPRAQRPRSEQTVQKPPLGWFTTAECSELLEIEASSVGRWRMAGRFGGEGEGWVNCGRTFYFSPAGIETAMENDSPPELDSLIAEIQAA